MSKRGVATPNVDMVQHLRLDAGRWLRGLREEAGLSQRQLAQAVGFEYYTFISQLEGGRGRLPQGQYLAFARALNVPLRDFVKTLTKFYDPITYYALFEAEEQLEEALPAKPVASQNVDDLAERLARLEALVANKNT